MKRTLLAIIVFWILLLTACSAPSEGVVTEEPAVEEPAVEETVEETVTESIREVIGQWVDEAWPGGAIITMTCENETIILDMEFNDGSRYREEMVEKTVAGQQRFEEKGGTTLGDYYVINARGDLDMYDEYGYIRTAHLKK